MFLWRAVNHHLLDALQARVCALITMRPCAESLCGESQCGCVSLNVTPIFTPQSYTSQRNQQCEHFERVHSSSDGRTTPVPHLAFLPTCYSTRATSPCDMLTLVLHISVASWSLPRARRITRPRLRTDVSAPMRWVTVKRDTVQMRLLK